MQEVVAALVNHFIIRATSATHIRASVWIGRTNLIGTLRRSQSVIRVYFKHTRLKNNSDGGIQYIICQLQPFNFEVNLFIPF